MCPTRNILYTVSFLVPLEQHRTPPFARRKPIGCVARSPTLEAYGALAMGMGSRALFQRAQEQAYFVSAVNALAQGRLVPVPGGVLIQDGTTLLGAIGVSGDTSDNDEICAIAGIEATGLKANPG